VTDKISAAWQALPRPIRSFIVDAVEGSVAAVAIVNLALPHNVTEAVAQTTLIVGAVATPIVAAARRDILPAILEWWSGVKASA